MPRTFHRDRFTWLAYLSAGLKPLAQHMEALRAGRIESVSTDFHELRQEFIPPDHRKLEPLKGTHHDLLATPLPPYLGNVRA
jgi:hypothetical protein